MIAATGRSASVRVVQPAAHSYACVLIMGVSGSGKTTVGRLLSERTGRPFMDGDALHPPANVAKMAAGIPLTDEDRWPWLDKVGEWIVDHRTDGIMACSALKRAYRDRLRQADPDLRLVYLCGDRALLEDRIGQRHGHFFPAGLLDAQLADLEEPTADEHSVTVYIGPSPEELVTQITVALDG
jgi:gluconokinase